MSIPNVLRTIFSVEQLQWLLLNYVLVSEFLKKKDSGEIAFDLISLFHVQMKTFAFPAKLYYHKIFETKSR